MCFEKCNCQLVSATRIRFGEAPPVFCCIFPSQEENFKFQRFRSFDNSSDFRVVGIFLFFDESSGVPQRFSAFLIARFFSYPHPYPVNTVIQYKNILQNKKKTVSNINVCNFELTSESRSVCCNGFSFTSATLYFPLLSEHLYKRITVFCFSISSSLPLSSSLESALLFKGKYLSSSVFSLFAKVCS